MTWFLLTVLFVAAMPLIYGKPPKKEMKILFLGNSFTFRNNLPMLVKQIFEEGNPGLKVHVEKVTYGGQDMYRHSEWYFSETFIRLNSITVPEIERLIQKQRELLRRSQAPTEYAVYCKTTGTKMESWQRLKIKLERSIRNQQTLIERIKQNRRLKWDYVVLQSWLDIVDNPDKGYAKYVKKLAAIAAKEHIKPVLYITAPYAQNQKPVKAPIAIMRTDKELKSAHELAGEIHAFAVIPVPLVLKKIQSGGTDLKFRYVNDFHPNQYCAFLTANMFYAAFFKRSPEGLNFNKVVGCKAKNNKGPDGKERTVVFDDMTKKYLQKMAFESVEEFDKQ